MGKPPVPRRRARSRPPPRLPSRGERPVVPGCRPARRCAVILPQPPPAPLRFQVVQAGHARWCCLQSIARSQSIHKMGRHCQSCGTPVAVQQNRMARRPGRCRRNHRWKKQNGTCRTSRCAAWQGNETVDDYPRAMARIFWPKKETTLLSKKPIFRAWESFKNLKSSKTTNNGIRHKIISSFSG